MAAQRPPVAVVDDDEAILESFKFWFEAEGIPLRTYPSAFAYLADDRAATCGLIVDQNMPGMTGTALATQLRALGAAIPVMLMTSTISAFLLAQAAAAGIEHVEEKPLAEDVVIAFVEACHRAANTGQGDDPQMSQ